MQNEYNVAILPLNDISDNFRSFILYAEELNEDEVNKIRKILDSLNLNFESKKDENNKYILKIFIESKDELSVLLKIKDSQFFKEVSESIERFNSIPKPLKIGSKNFDFSKRTYIMGILNVTPDSFYDGGKYFTFDSALKHAKELIENEADIIDIGGQSTRPGSLRVTEEEEAKRVIPIIKEIRKYSDIPISIDTYYSKVAEEAVIAGADLINDISGLTADLNMVNVCKKYNVPIVIMHIRGNPSIMQKNVNYNNVVMDVLRSLRRRIKFAEINGIDESKIIVDPGLGFGKKFEDNILLMKNLEVFKCLGLPILIGHSRKSFLGKMLGGLPVEERLEPSLAVLAYLILKGANIIRVHDVKESVRIRKSIDFIKFFSH